LDRGFWSVNPRNGSFAGSAESAAGDHSRAISGKKA